MQLSILNVFHLVFHVSYSSEIGVDLVCHPVDSRKVVLDLISDVTSGLQKIVIRERVDFRHLGKGRYQRHLSEPLPFLAEAMLL
jgi:hypothetical protein